jgi:hypothetical protein
VAAEIGMTAGMKGSPKGGGLLGAVVAKELSFSNKRDLAKTELQRSKVGGSPSKGPTIFLNQVHRPVMLGPTPAPRTPVQSASTPEASGQKKLGEALQSAAGKIGEFLKSSKVGQMLRSVDGLQEALATKATERLKSEQFFLRF